MSAPHPRQPIKPVYSTRLARVESKRSEATRPPRPPAHLRLLRPFAFFASNLSFRQPNRHHRGCQARKRITQKTQRAAKNANDPELWATPAAGDSQVEHDAAYLKSRVAEVHKQT